MERATELEYLRWIFNNIDFGPSHEDCMAALNEGFKKEAKKRLPKGYYDAI
jgi:hypothetical protein